MRIRGVLPIVWLTFVLSAALGLLLFQVGRRRPRAGVGSLPCLILNLTCLILNLLFGRFADVGLVAFPPKWRFTHVLVVLLAWLQFRVRGFRFQKAAKKMSESVCWELCNILCDGSP